MDKMWQILIVLVGTFCLTIILGLVGVFYGKVDAQFIEGLVSGSLVSLITMMIKDITGQVVAPPPIVSSNKGEVDTNPILFFVGFSLFCLIIGCVSAGIQGTGVDVRSPVYGEASSNSINGEMNAGI